MVCKALLALTFRFFKKEEICPNVPSHQLSFRLPAQLLFLLLPSTLTPSLAPPLLFHLSIHLNLLEIPTGQAVITQARPEPGDWPLTQSVVLPGALSTWGFCASTRVFIGASLSLTLSQA